VAALPRQGHRQHRRLPRLSGGTPPPEYPQIAQLKPILKLSRCRLTPVGFEHWLAAAGDLLLGASCHGCGQPWWGICPLCRQQVASRRPFLTTPVPCPDGFPVTVTSSIYDPILRRLISAHKERQALALTSFLAERLALSVHGLLASEPFAVHTSRIVLVPIPSAAGAVRRRGFDATASMARLAARRLRVRYSVTVRSALTQRRRVADQAGLDAAARHENLAGAFRLRRPISTGAAVLVDDLVTTGSSLTEAARVLRAAKIPVFGAATVAATVRVRPPSSPQISDLG
jgi:predicted amidophosphoribosyltransferase